MALPLDAPLVLSAVRAVIRYRGRVDEILSLNEATAGLPFRLPDPPQDRSQHEDAMFAFFETDGGTTVLALHRLSQDFDELLKARKAGAKRKTVERQLNNCLSLYFEACEINPAVALPGASEEQLRRNASSGPSEQMRLAYYVVESDRLSRNPVLTRIILATADTLLEVAGENASVFVSNPKTRSLLENLIEEFAGKRDFDDDSATEILRHLISATATAALDHPELLPNKPALMALYGAIKDVREALKGENQSEQQAQEAFFRLIQPDGLKRIVNACMTRVAKDPSFVTSNELARKAISAVLIEVHDNFLDIFDDEPARYRALEALIAVGADHVQGLLAREAGRNRPFSAAVLAAVATSVRESARNHGLADKISRGELLGDLYGAALAAVAAGGDSLRTEAHVSKFVSDMVTALAGKLAALPPDLVGDPQTRDALLAAALRVLADHSRTVAGNSAFASTVLAAALAAAADAAADGLTVEDAETLLDAALRSAGEHAGLAGFDEAQAAALQSMAKAITDAKLEELSHPAARKALLLGTIAALNANPKVWTDPRARDQLQPLIDALIEVVRTGKARGLLSEQSMVEVIKRVLAAASRRARTVADGGAAGTQELKQILLHALDFADAELGRSVAHEDVPALLERVAQAFLRAPFALADAAAKIDELLRDVQKWLEEGR